jgi:thymidylate kinase
VTVALKERLEGRYGVDCFKTPSYDGPIGRLIRNAFEGKAKVTPLAMMHLFNADAIDQEGYIRACLAKGRNVILDRHTRISGCVYQTEHHPLPVILGNLPLSLFKRVDLCVLLDAPVEVLAQRIVDSARDTKTTDKLYTSSEVEHLQRLRANYAMAPALHTDLVERWLHFDTSKPDLSPEAIARAVAIELDL